MNMNKYQEALDRIKSTDFSTDYWTSSYVEDRCSDEIDILQELIDLVGSLKRERDQEYALRCEYEEELEELKSGW